MAPVGGGGCHARKVAAVAPDLCALLKLHLLKLNLLKLTLLTLMLPKLNLLKLNGQGP